MFPETDSINLLSSPPSKYEHPIAKTTRVGVPKALCHQHLSAILTPRTCLLLWHCSGAGLGVFIQLLQNASAVCFAGIYALDMAP